VCKVILVIGVVCKVTLVIGVVCKGILVIPLMVVVCKVTHVGSLCKLIMVMELCARGYW
jgi:hypothetical protein